LSRNGYKFSQKLDKNRSYINSSFIIERTALYYYGVPP
jgi:hypothetical protein